MSTSLLNRAAIKRHVLATAKQTRPHLGLTRVSAEGLDAIEAAVRRTIEDMLHAHPSVGKTFKP